MFIFEIVSQNLTRIWQILKNDKFIVTTKLQLPNFNLHYLLTSTYITYKLQPTNFNLRTSTYKLQPTNFNLHYLQTLTYITYKLQPTNFKLQPNYNQTSTFKLQPPNSYLLLSNKDIIYFGHFNLICKKYMKIQWLVISMLFICTVEVVVVTPHHLVKWHHRVVIIVTSQHKAGAHQQFRSNQDNILPQISLKLF